MKLKIERAEWPEKRLPFVQGVVATVSCRHYNHTKCYGYLSLYDKMHEPRWYRIPCECGCHDSPNYRERYKPPDNTA